MVSGAGGSDAARSVVDEAVGAEETEAASAARLNVNEEGKKQQQHKVTAHTQNINCT
jgi:hypothetical protein